jgi:hypothetical protein
LYPQISMSGKGSKSQKTLSSVPGDRVGGPSTIRGINYQINFAILKTLELLGRAKSSPLQRFSVTLEARFVGEAVTAWDVRSSPPDVLTEVKLAATCSEALDWLERVRRSGFQGAFQLICGKKRGISYLMWRL